MHEVYGIDLSDRELLAARSWPWLWLHVYGLLSVDRGLHGGGSRLQRVLHPVEMPKMPGAPGQT